MFFNAEPLRRLRRSVKLETRDFALLTASRYANQVGPGFIPDG